MNHARTSNRVVQPGRAGTILICVLACLAITTAMVTATLRSTLRDYREVRKERILRQTELVLEAGILRAREQLAANPEYEGETWQLSDSIVPGEIPATVEIAVDRAGDSPRVGVTARLGVSPQIIQRSFEFNFEPTTLSNEE